MSHLLPGLPVNAAILVSFSWCKMRRTVAGAGYLMLRHILLLAVAIYVSSAISWRAGCVASVSISWVSV